MLQEIKLDDRSYQEIRDDAVKNIVKHCPEWTNHNASDPGITIIELLSSMTEDVINRLNIVPDKNYLAFLDLIGVQQRLPQPSSTEVTFYMSEGHQATDIKKSTTLIKKGSVVSTDPKGDEEPILFETVRDLYISNIKLLNVYSKSFNEYRQREDIIDNTSSFMDKKPFKPFSIDGSSDNIIQIYLSSKGFEAFNSSAKVTVLFRLPTTMRVFDIKYNFLENIRWEFYNGVSWQPLEIIYNHIISVDDKDADIISVTFKGGGEKLNLWVLEQFSQEEKYYIRGTVEEAPSWLNEFAVYEISIITSSDDDGLLPTITIHNDETLDLNSDIYPFGSRPKIDDKMRDEIFYINSDEAFGVPGTYVSIYFKQSLNPAYLIPKKSKNLRLVWEYSVDNNRWDILPVTDDTKQFTQDGTVSFEVPHNIKSIIIGGEEGYWIRCRMVDGDYGMEEQTIYDESVGRVVTTPSTLRPPALSKIIINYKKPREDIKDCWVLSNFKYKKIEFIKDIPVTLFESKGEREEALFLAFDSYLSEDYLSLYFDIDSDRDMGENIYTQQRVVEWMLLKDGKWIKLDDVVDMSEGLTTSGSVIIKLPQIDRLEKYILYMQEYERMWIKAKVKLNSLKKSPSINRILLNTVRVVQEETYYDELLGRSDGLPNLKFQLNYKNLSKAPVIYVGDDEYKAVDRFIDYSKDDKVFRFNGIDGIIEFGDGEFGTIPPLGENIYIKEYSITEGKRGNVNSGEITVLRESINYVDSIINYMPSINGEDGDTLQSLKKHAPLVLKTMDRAISVEDYELLSENFSPAIKRAKCIVNDGEVIIIPLTKTIIEDNGFINKKLLNDLRVYLKERSLLTVDPVVVSPTVIRLSVYMKLVYTIENYNISKVELQNRILNSANRYFDPHIGYNGDGFPLGKLISKSDFYNIIQNTDNNIFIDEIKFSINGSKKYESRVNLASNQLVKIDSVYIEELSYDR